MEQEITTDDLIYKTCNKIKSKPYDFQKVKTIRSFEREIYSSIVIINDVFEEQIKMRLMYVINLLN